MRNTFGNIFTLTTFGESHGEAIGGVVDGMPAGIDIDVEFIQNELNRRRPGQSKITTGRDEKDKVEILSGVFGGKSTGCPIGFVVRNNSQRSSDYSNLKDLFRPSHADYTYYKKYGIRDFRGGGRASARITISRCVGGALAKLVLRKLGVSVYAYTSQVGNIKLEKDYTEYNPADIETNIMRCPDTIKASLMEKTVLDVKQQGDSIGGTITCVIKGCPPGVGEPEFDKLHAALGYAVLSINAAKGIEFGAGFEGAAHMGSEMNDCFMSKDGKVETLTNNSGGIQGGISNGNDIVFRVAFKPVPTVLKEQQTVDKYCNNVIFKAQGRHDPCVLPRAVPVVESMAAMVILDYIMLQKSTIL